jgi:diadenosine tetraphosphate (Ap4A) HIT family hydrolase
MHMACELCERDGGEVLWRDEVCRVVRVDEPGYPGFCRVIWNAHVKEMTDLAAGERAHFVGVVLAVEAALRDLLAPDKINLASLGNMTPHLHWHVIPRFRDDPHFPNPIWSAPLRSAPAARGGIAGLGDALTARLSSPGRATRDS